MMSSIGFTYSWRMLSRHINYFLAVAEHGSLPVPPVRCTSPSLRFPSRFAVRGEFRRAAV